MNRRELFKIIGGAAVAAPVAAKVVVAVAEQQPVESVVDDAIVHPVTATRYRPGTEPGTYSTRGVECSGCPHYHDAYPTFIEQNPDMAYEVPFDIWWMHRCDRVRFSPATRKELGASRRPMDSPEKWYRSCDDVRRDNADRCVRHVPEKCGDCLYRSLDNICDRSSAPYSDVLSCREMLELHPEACWRVTRADMERELSQRMQATMHEIEKEAFFGRGEVFGPFDADGLKACPTGSKAIFRI